MSYVLGLVHSKTYNVVQYIYNLVKHGPRHVSKTYIQYMCGDIFFAEVKMMLKAVESEPNLSKFQIGKSVKVLGHRNDTKSKERFRFMAGKSSVFHFNKLGYAKLQKSASQIL